MKNIKKSKDCAFTRTELVVVIAIITALAAVLVPALAQSQQRAQRLTCVNNLKIIGLAYRVFADSHGGLPPAQVATAQGGWQDLKAGNLIGPGIGDGAGSACFTNYEIMQNELGQSPRTVVCPADDRIANTNFYDTFGNTNCSYWVGPGATSAYPQSLLGGDRNLGGGATATGNGTQDPNYGFSPTMTPFSGVPVGADVQVSTNGQILTSVNGQTGYCQWSAKLHSGGNPVGAGNILLGDGGVQQVTSSNFRFELFNVFGTNAAGSGNYGGGPMQAHAVRLIFP